MLLIYTQSITFEEGRYAKKNWKKKQRFERKERYAEKGKWRNNVDRERYNSDGNVNMKAVSLRTASHPRRRHCSHSTWLSLPSLLPWVCRCSCTAASASANPRAVPVIITALQKGLSSPLTSRFRTSQGRSRAHSKRFLRPPKGWISGLSSLPRITWSWHQTLITNLDQVTCRMKTPTYSTAFCDLTPCSLVDNNETFAEKMML